MGYLGGLTNKPHAVCIPFPAQGHINPMLMLAKLLHQKGFHITLVNTEFNHQRLLNARGSHALDGLPSFRFETIPDGLPPSAAADATQDIPSLCESTSKTCLPHFKQLLHKLNVDSSSNDAAPPVSCIVSDAIMSFTLDAAQELGIPNVLFWTASACGFLAYCHYRELMDKGYIPLKDWIPAMKGIRLKDFPPFFRTTDPDFFMLQFVLRETERARKASAIILNTFDELEHQVLQALSSMLSPPIYSVGPLHTSLNHQVNENELKQLGSNLWKEDSGCVEWLDSKDPNSVVYVNFGSVTVMTPDQLNEFAWGLAKSNQPFLWVIRPDLVGGDSAILPPEFLVEIKGRGLLVSWCPQEQVLSHPSIGGFLTHSGWNSTIESISSGVPMICWPFFAEQQTNCWFSCNEWGIGMEIENDVERRGVEGLLRELMEEEKGKAMKKRALEWKKMAEMATTSQTASSYKDLDQLINQVLLSPKE